MKNKIITLRLDIELYNKVKKISDNKKISFNSYINTILKSVMLNDSDQNIKLGGLQIMGNRSEIKSLISKMREIQKEFYEEFKVDDIWSNSKIYEILIADHLDHFLIPGHSGSKDASYRNFRGKIIECEYKHYKETSSNHTWTFNDFSDTTIKELRADVIVFFTHIDDVDTDDKNPSGIFDWYYAVPGEIVADFLEEKTPSITNKRKMINISRNNIENVMGIKKSFVRNPSKLAGRYADYLNEIFSLIARLEELTETENLLTSNKFWELLVALELGHDICSEQGGREGAHDAYDSEGNSYEYKVSKSHSWNFQDISPAVLKKYYSDKEIILAVVDKKNIEVIEIYSAKPKDVVPRLEEKLEEKLDRNNGNIRRLQVSLSKGDLSKIKAIKKY